MKSPEPNVTRAQYAADKLIREYGLTRPSEIVLEHIAWDRGVQVQLGPIQGAEAWLLRKGRRGLVRISDRTRERGRQRFGIGHELGHWEMHLDLSQAWLCTSDDIHAYRGSAAEIEANVFAASLLMPDAMLRSRLASASVSFDLIRSVADEFDTTLTATALRIVEESNEDCYVVLSKRGVIRWWKRNERRSSFYLNRGQSISPESLAWRCEYDQVEHTAMAAVPTHAWFRDCRDARDVEVWEESLLMRDYQTVLSLISVV